MPVKIVRGGESTLAREVAKLEAAGAQVTQVLPMIGGGWLVVTSRQKRIETRAKGGKA